MSFAHAGWLWALALLPVLALLEWHGLRRAERALKLLAGARPNAALLAQRAPGSRRAGLLLRLGALALLALGAAGPEWGREAVRRSSSGSDLVFVLDVSASMDTRDVPPSRLDEARREALGLLDRVAGCRVGVVAFAGDAVRLCPLTLDQAAVRLTLEALTRDAVSTPGTDLGRALRTALALLPPGHRADQAIVLWTDGEDLEGRGQGAIADLQRAGVRVFAVGVGTPAGDVIPVLDDQGRTVDVKRDEQGTPVRSRLDEPLLRELARGTRGGYFPAARPGGQLAQLTAALGGLARSLHGARLVERPIARFTLCALLAAALLAFDLARARRRLPAAAARAAAAAAAALALVAGAAPARAQSDWAKGDAAFRRGHLAQAESLYARRARGRAPAPLLVNLATVRAMRAPGDSLAQALSALSAPDDRAGRTAGYNLGTLLGQQQQYDHALAELRRELERDPNDADARWNYELLERRRQEARNPPPRPSPKSSAGGGGGAPPPQPQPQGGAAPRPGAGAPPPPSALGSPPSSSAPAGGPAQMTREQAERLLGSLQELERVERQRLRRTQVMQERRGRDW